MKLKDSPEFRELILLLWRNGMGKIKVWIEQGVVWGLNYPADEGFRQIVKHATRDVYVTSGREGDHDPASLHYLGLAWDMRSCGLTKKQMYGILPGGELCWDIVYYPDWKGYHIEYDPK
jgi:hypothetical protein